MKDRYVAAEKIITFRPVKGRVFKQHKGWIVFDRKDEEIGAYIVHRSKARAIEHAKALNK